MRSISAHLKSAIRNPQSAIFIAFAAMLAVSWRRWTSPIADSGREMDLPLRLLEGEMLYRDVHYLYPPLSPYFNALLYRIFGAHLDVLHASGIACAVMIAWLCYRIARRLLPPAEASVATTGVIVWCIFKPAGNLISPYSFAALYAMLLGLGALLMTLRYAAGVQSAVLCNTVGADLCVCPGGVQPNRGRHTGLPLRGYIIFAGILVGLAAITKQEFAFAAAATVAAAVIHLRRTQWKPLIADLALAAIPAMLIAAPVYGWLLQTVGWETLVADCHLFYTHLPKSLVFYNAHRTGLDRPLFSIVQMLGASAVIAAATSAIVLVSNRTRRTLRRSIVILACALLAVLIIKLIVGNQWDGSPLRALPLLLIAIVVRSPAFRRKGFAAEISPPEGGTTNVFIIAAYSLAILGRVALRVPSGGAFGGFFLPTSLIVIFYLLVCVLPYWIERRTRNELASNRGRKIGQGLFILMLIATAVVFSVRYRRNFTYEIHAPRGHFFAPHSSGQSIDEALRFLETETQMGEAVAVLPEGSDLTFLTGRRSRLRHQILIPGLMRVEDEREAIATLQRERVRYVLVVNRPMREFGREAFGRDFYPSLGNWIEEHYRVIRVFSAEGDPQAQIGDPAFFIKVFARID